MATTSSRCSRNCVKSLKKPSIFTIRTANRFPRLRRDVTSQTRCKTLLEKTRGEPGASATGVLPQSLTRPGPPVWSVAEFRAALGELLLQPRDDAGMHLAHAGLAQVESRADLLHRHVFVVVKDDDKALVAVEAAGDEPHQVAVLQTVGGVFGLLVFQNVDLADVFVTVGLVPLFVQAHQTHGSRLADHLIQFLDADAHPLGEFIRPRRAAKRGLESLAGFFEFAGLAADQPWHPVHRS